MLEFIKLQYQPDRLTRRQVLALALGEIREAQAKMIPGGRAL